MSHFSSNASNILTLQPQQKQRQLSWAIVLVLSFAAIEALVGWHSHSVALVAEAGHLVADSAALGLALWATLKARPALKSGWIGQHSLSLTDQEPNSETWAAFINSLGLVGTALWVALEAVLHWHHEGDVVQALPMLLTAIVGLFVNGINIAVLHSGSQQDLNLKGAFLHVVGDFLGSLGVVVAAIAVAVMHWMWADCAVGLAIAGLMMVVAVPLVGQSGRRLLRTWVRF
jgi:cobalt-zinc-cadmium efflux system protein